MKILGIESSYDDTSVSLIESSPGLRIADAIAGIYRSHFDNPTELTKKLIGKLENKKTTQRVGGQKTR